MKFELQHLDLIDLISERHLQLRKLCEKIWLEHNDVVISNSEWFIMARIDHKQTTMSQITKSADITRQAVHKLVKQLASKGLVEIKQSENNNKEKSVRLTDLGKKYYEKNEALKAELADKIRMTIGEEKVNLLKQILQMDWGI